MTPKTVNNTSIRLNTIKIWRRSPPMLFGGDYINIADFAQNCDEDWRPQIWCSILYKQPNKVEILIGASMDALMPSTRLGHVGPGPNIFTKASLRLQWKKAVGNIKRLTIFKATKDLLHVKSINFWEELEVQLLFWKCLYHGNNALLGATRIVWCDKRISLIKRKLTNLLKLALVLLEGQY